MSDYKSDVAAFVKEHGKKTVTVAFLSKLIEDVTDGLIKALMQQRERIAALEASHAALSDKALRGGLPWAKGTTYHGGDVVQHDGSLWRCVETHGSGANFSHEHFILQVKRGRDGRDAR